MQHKDEAGLALHRRLLEGDPIAPSEVAEQFLLPLKDYLRRKYPQTEPEMWLDAATMALLNYVKQPDSYKPEGKSLFNFLKMAAEGDLKNDLARHKRRTSRIVSLNHVALANLAGNINVEEEFITRQDVTSRLQGLKRYQAKTSQSITEDEPDRRLLELMQAKVRATAEYAKVLGIEHLPLQKQREEVKRNKDRLSLRLKRWEEKSRLQGQDHEP